MTLSLTDWAQAHGGRLDGPRVLHYGDPAEEYHAARNRVVLFDRSERGRLRLSGTDALDVLHRTTTQDLKGLIPGQGAATVIQTETARIVDWVTLWARGGDVIAVTGEGRAQADRDWIERVVIMDDVVIEDVSESTGLFELAGPGASRTATVLAGPEAATLAPCHHRAFAWNGTLGLVARGRASTPNSYWILVEGPEAGRAAGLLLAAELAVPAGHLVSEALRIEAGEPLSGRELTAETNPLEAGLSDAIGFSKGCYTGQEVIARMITYKSLRRTLSGLLFDEPVAPPSAGGWFPILPSGLVGEGGAVESPPGSEALGDPALAARYSIGRLTSTAWSYGLNRWIGLGIVTLETARPGTAVVVDSASGPVRATTAALPLRP
jgi:folate-binding protein YgfZ